MAKRKPDRLATLRGAFSIANLVRFKREAEYHQKTADFIARLIRKTRQEERGDTSYEDFNLAYERLIAHLGMIAGSEEVGINNIERDSFE